MPPLNAPPIFCALVRKPPTAVIAVPIAGLSPIKLRIAFAVDSLEVVAHCRKSFPEPIKAPFIFLAPAIDVFIKLSQLPPNCSSDDPTFCCISLACLSKFLFAVFVDPAYSSIALAAAFQLVVVLSVSSATAFISVRITFIPSWPNIAFKAASCCSLPRFLSAPESSLATCGIGFMLPSASRKEIPNSSM